MISNVTVLMPVYNGGKFLKDSIESILNQTYPDFVLLVINDGSTDDTEKIILSFNDKRIKYVKNDGNIGLVNTLNKGIDLTETEYLVRMDADDISVPNRLECQLLFMNAHPEIGISGGKYEIFGNENGVPEMLIENDSIKANLLFTNPLCHPTVILRTEIFKKNNFKFGAFDFQDSFGFKVTEIEDYVMWYRVRDIVRFANLDKVLLKYRKVGQNFSTANSNAVFERKKIFYAQMLNELKMNPSPLNLEIHISFANLSRCKSAYQISLFNDHLIEIINKNSIENIYSQNALIEIIYKKWEQLFYYLPKLGFKYVCVYWYCNKKIKIKELSYYFKYIFNKTFRQQNIFL